MNQYVKGLVIALLTALVIICCLYGIEWIVAHDHREHRHPQHPLQQHGHPHNHDGQTMKPQIQDHRA